MREILTQGNRLLLQEQRRRSEGEEGEAIAEVLLKAGVPNSDFVPLIAHEIITQAIAVWTTRPKYIYQW